MNINELVNVETGIISRQIFVDQDLYDLELKQIFSRCWLYLGHESQLKEPGDYYTTYMGEDPVIVTRGENGEIRAFLNSCMHRGMRICRSDAGNSSFFRCPYHGWTYKNNGELIGVPQFKNGYFEKLNKQECALVEVGQLENYKGMLWATWDPEAPSFSDYLGDMKFYLDLMIDRSEGGVEVIHGVQKWRIDTNWKICADNFVGDMYHVPVSHGSARAIGVRGHYGNGYQINPGNGHGFGGEFGGIGGGGDKEARTAYETYVENMRQRISQDKGEIATKIVPLGHMTIFPNFSALDTLRYRTFRVWQPRGPHCVEVHSWGMVDKALPEEVREQVRQQYIFTFGPSGIFEQEDGENWSQVTASTKGWVSRQQTFNYQLGLGEEKTVKEVLGVDMPGKMGNIWSEINQRGFYKRWLELMTADSWQSIVR